MNFLLTIILIVFYNIGEIGRVIAVIISTFLVTIISLYLLIRDKLISVKYEKHKYLKENISFGLPLLPHVFGLFLLSSIDRFFISKKYGLSEAGIYMMAFQISLGMIILFDALNKAITPYLFKMLARNSKSDLYKIVKYSYLLFLACLILGSIAYILSPYFVIIIGGDKYIEATLIVPILCLGQAFQGMYLIVTNYIFYTKKTYLLSIVTISSGIINIILIIILMNEMGILGASIAFAISMFIRFISTWLLSQKVFPLPWNLLKKNH
nr:polysaccharide biosynthesis C-terminal domain-containing protein [Providencia rettgeri]